MDCLGFFLIQILYLLLFGWHASFQVGLKHRPIFGPWHHALLEFQFFPFRKKVHFLPRRFKAEFENVTPLQLIVCCLNGPADGPGPWLWQVGRHHAFPSRRTRRLGRGDLVGARLCRLNAIASEGSPDQLHPSTLKALTHEITASLITLSEGGGTM